MPFLAERRALQTLEFALAQGHSQPPRVTLKSEVRTRMVHARAPLAHVELFFELNSTEL